MWWEREHCSPDASAGFFVLASASCCSRGKPMLRFTMIALALTGLMAAGPAHRPPTPASLPPQTGAADPATVEAQKDSETQDKNRKAADSRNKVWDAKMKKTMGGVCGG